MKHISIALLTISSISGCTHAPKTPPLINTYYIEIDSAYDFAKPCLTFMKDNNSIKNANCEIFHEIYTKTKNNGAYKAGTNDPDFKKSFGYQWGYWNAQNGNIGKYKEDIVIRTDNLYRTLSNK